MPDYTCPEDGCGTTMKRDADLAGVFYRCPSCGIDWDAADIEPDYQSDELSRCVKCGGPAPFHDPACIVHPGSDESAVSDA